MDNLKIGDYSSLRKLMRAAYQGRIPDERVVIIQTAMQKAGEHKEDYMSAYKRRQITYALSAI